MHILVVEDEKTLCDTIARSLRRLAYSVDCCYDGQSAAEMLAVECFDLVVLDLNLPGEDGMTVLRTLRERDRDTKVLILSARCEVADKVAGLDAGANDYLTKPFHLDELAARIRSLTLRRFTQSDVVLTCAELSFDTKARTASVRGETLTLAALVVISFVLSFACEYLPGISALSGGTRTIILTVAISAAAAVLFPVKDQEAEHDA